ncbi:MAG: 50S ribosomal protein L20 [Nitrospirae bacterium GWC2_57_13]|jgi:large subunit ribosomal protein L20|nr:MAG: 50S ribosomal protein L20 [Nitrospirae bacterium GWC1_57_7]OGW28097.1 MAG: 50S ribosomal protein L20 [Nitrospirae bacterium GWC2_57_13]HAR46874.1 50S ribosomal protein L20 [Nitrospiraceae bacterium]HAS54962.1 50S ribosomal protein L20 [Nitrospiraceae bacterium]
MPRAKGGPKTRARRKRVLNQAEGFWGAKSRLYRIATEAVDRALKYSYRDRKARKRDFRRLWIARINAAARLNGLSYSRFIAGLAKSGVGLDRKVLADLAVTDPAGFARIAETAKTAS